MTANDLEHFLTSNSIVEITYDFLSLFDTSSTTRRQGNWRWSEMYSYALQVLLWPLMPMQERPLLYFAVFFSLFSNIVLGRHRTKFDHILPHCWKWSRFENVRPKFGPQKYQFSGGFTTMSWFKREYLRKNKVLTNKKQSSKSRRVAYNFENLANYGLQMGEI